MAVEAKTVGDDQPLVGESSSAASKTDTEGKIQHGETMTEQARHPEPVGLPFN